jgi:hypothetical protein
MSKEDILAAAKEKQLLAIKLISDILGDVPWKHS